MRKGRINPFVSRWSVSFEFGFCRGKTRFTHVIAANCKRANSHNFKIKNLNFNGLGHIFKTSVTVFHYTDLPAGK